MTTLQTAAQQALEALLTYEQYIQPLTNYFGGPRVPEEGSASAKVDAAITALKAALAQEQAEPNVEYERGFIDGMQMQTKSSVDRAVNRMAQEQAEPVAWMVYTLDGKSVCVTDNPADFTEQHKALPLYAAPPQRKPLTDEKIANVYIEWDKTPGASMADFARAIERAHWIGGPE